MRTLFSVSAIMFFTAAGMQLVDGHLHLALVMTAMGAVVFLLRTAFALPGRE